MAWVVALKGQPLLLSGISPGNISVIDASIAVSRGAHTDCCLDGGGGGGGQGVSYSLKAMRGGGGSKNI